MFSNVIWQGVCIQHSWNTHNPIAKNKITQFYNEQRIWINGSLKSQLALNFNIHVRVPHYWSLNKLKPRWSRRTNVNKDRHLGILLLRMWIPAMAMLIVMDDLKLEPFLTQQSNLGIDTRPRVGMLKSYQNPQIHSKYPLFRTVKTWNQPGPINSWMECSLVFS